MVTFVMLRFLVKNPAVRPVDNLEQLGVAALLLPLLATDVLLIILVFRDPLVMLAIAGLLAFVWCVAGYFREADTDE